MIVAVARDQRVLRVDRVINARADRGETSRYEQPFADRDQIKRWVKERGSEQFIVVRFVSVSFQKERRLPGLDRPAKIAAKLANLKRCAFTRNGRKRIARVQTFIVEIERSVAAKLIRARFGENLNARRRLIVFRRERVLLNANLADRFLWRHVSAGESVDKDLAAVGPD